MITYILVRIGLILITLIGIMFINFALLNLLNVGVIETVMVETENFAFNLGAQQITPDLQATYLSQLQEHFGLNQSLGLRFITMLKNYLLFDFGESFFLGEQVVTLILKALPVSLSLGFFSTLIIYGIAILLGAKKAAYHQSIFDNMSSLFLVILYVIPVFCMSLLLIYITFNFKPFRMFQVVGLVSENFKNLSLIGKILDYFKHMALPMLANVLSALFFATMLSKAAFFKEINQTYYKFALFLRQPQFTLCKDNYLAKHLMKNSALGYGFIIKNVSIILFADFPSIFIGMVFGSSLFIEIIFSLNGIGLLGYEAFLNKDYPIILAITYLICVIGLITRLITDILYAILDPRVRLQL
ncbi:ABC transporter permease protein [Candidatus Hepatincolaceae symbiont of Richtersius coronifer]